MENVHVNYTYNICDYEFLIVIENLLFELWHKRNPRAPEFVILELHGEQQLSTKL